MKTKIIILTMLVPFTVMGQQPCKDLFISEYIDGPNKNKVIEIFNPSDSVINLIGYSIKIFQNGAPTPLTVPLTGSINPKSTYVVSHPQASPAILAKTDQTHVWMNFDGNDAVVLNKGQSFYIDKIGEIGVNPGNSGWFVPPNGSTKDQNLRRKYPIDKGETDWNQGKNQWDIQPSDSIGNIKDHTNICQCLFSLVNGNSWYIKGVLDYTPYQQDVYVFRLTNKQAYTGQLNTNIVDSITFHNATGLKYNTIHFNLLSTQQDREQIRNQIRNDSLFEIEFPAVTKFPAADRTQKRWQFTNDVINLVFRDPDPSPTTVQYIENKYNLTVMHQPNPALPKGANSWTYAYVINPTGCKTRNAMDVSREIYEKDSATVKIAEPWMEPFFEPVTTNDQYFPDSWQILNTGQCLGMAPAGNGTFDADCDIEEAWNAGYTGNGITVAVIDKSIFENNHPDISSKYINGYDWIDNDNDVTASSGATGIAKPHGQSCAGLIAAVANNNIGIAGVAYGAQIVPLITWYGSSYVAFQDALAKNVDVISCSWGWAGNPSQAIENDINLCRTLGRGGKGIVIVFSAGNADANTTTFFPGYLDDVIGVIASNPNDTRKSSSDGWGSWGSNYGSKSDVAAPGTHVVTTDLLGADGYNNISNGCSGGNNLINDYTYFNGTSAAAPIVAGAAAVILSVDPSLTATAVQNILESTADKVGGYNYNAVSPGRSLEMGYGRINLFSAVQSVGIAEYSNEQNIWFTVYPNPTINNATIQFSLLQTSAVQIEIYNHIGKKLKTLYNDNYISPQNPHILSFETGSFSSGIYFLVLRTENGIKALKLTVVK